MSKKKLLGLAIWAACFVAILVVASLYDLKINVALGNADSVYGQFFRLFGELTGWIVVPIAGMFLFRVTGTKNKMAIIITVFWAIVTVVGWFLTFNYIFKELTGAAYAQGYYASPYSHIAVYAIAFAILATAGCLALVRRIPKDVAYKLAMFGAALLVALAISQACTYILKNIWTRQRFRNLPIGNGGTDSTGFTPWYKPNFGKNKSVSANYFPDSAGMKEKDAYSSFPSGHTAGAALTFVLVMLPDLFEKLKKYKICFYLFAVAYTVAVAISRIVNRAHYLSDTLFGGTIGMFSSFAAIAIVNKLTTWGNRKFSRFIAAERVAADAPEEAPETITVVAEKKEEEVG